MAAALDVDALAAERDRLLSFATRAGHPDGGYAWLGDDGAPDATQPVHAWITCRMTHVHALAALLGDDRGLASVERGLAALRPGGVLHDDEHGGWFAAARLDGPETSDKRAYEHAFVVLAAASATMAGADGARDLLEVALGVLERGFWDETAGMLLDVRSRDWSDVEAYRGVNATMHTVEALLAAHDAGADPVWRERALRLTERVVHGFAREADWRLPEHFTPGWEPLPDYNADDRAHPFRPYGVTVGHQLEWARLALHLRAALGEGAPAWLVDDAVALAEAAVSRGWAADGADGFVYTLDWDDTPVVRQRLHWVVCEGIATAAVLAQVTGDTRWAERAAQWWEHAERCYLDRRHGSWHHELDPQNRPASTVWQGKPDVYHAYQAVLLPELLWRGPLGGSIAGMVRAGSVGDGSVGDGSVGDGSVRDARG